MAKRRTANGKARGKARRKVGVQFVRTKSKRVRFRARVPGRPILWSQSYASPQGARRAAKRQFKGDAILWGT